MILTAEGAPVLGERSVFPFSSIPEVFTSLLAVQARVEQRLGESAPEPASCRSWHICVFSILCLPHLLCLEGSRVEWGRKRRRGGWASESTDHMGESLRISISSERTGQTVPVGAGEASIPNGG